jgi:hypothetical protein
MTTHNEDVSLSREQVKKTLTALTGIATLVNGFATKSSHPREFESVMSHIREIQAIVTGHESKLSHPIEGVVSPVG